MSIIINPGSGPVDGASSQNARANIGHFCDDLAAMGKDVSNWILGGDNLGDGRWRYVITVDGHEHEVDMPGLPLDQVRWMDELDQNIWYFPRLYVDGSSWVWAYALSVVVPPPEEDDVP